MGGERGEVSLGVVTDRFLASARCRNPNTRRAYGAVLARLARDLGPRRVLSEVSERELAGAVEAAWGFAAGATWNRNRAAVSSFLAWAAKNRYPAPALPAALERRPEHRDETRALPRAAIERHMSRRELPLREKTLWRMLYETAARASEILALDIADLDLPARRAGTARVPAHRRVRAAACRALPGSGDLARLLRHESRFRELGSSA